MSALGSLRRAVRRRAYRAFYALPLHWRRRLVRLGTPGYTVGTVTLVREADGGPRPRILLLRQPPGPGWSLPGGLLQRGERPADGAVRELVEETGIAVPATQARRCEPNAVIHTRGQWVDLVYEVDVPRDVPIRIDEAEVHEAAWFTLDALPRLTGPTARLLAHYDIGPLAGNARDD
jgi:ADP-ribose pyrophosphatase YjhB (NUDIX family)